MKLLIVDDEKLTREGIQCSLDLEYLSISQVILADDGVHGLRAALSEKPDIVLTDVRMPRMNGVEMVEKILEQQPDTAVVFMSAYSDKEYLKAAIKLKAVSYVEKPLEMEELTAALKEAADSHLARTSSRSAVLIHEKEQLAHLAQLLMEPERGEPGEADQLAKSLKLPFGPGTCFVTVLVECLTPLSVLPPKTMDQLQARFVDYLHASKLAQVYAFRADRYIIIQLYGEGKPSEAVLSGCTRLLAEGLTGVCNFFITRGPAVCGADRAFQSGRKAWELLSDSFFSELDTELVPRDEETVPLPMSDMLTDFNLALSEQLKDRALAVADRLYRLAGSRQALAPSQVRDLYYKYLGKLDEYALSNHFSLWNRDEVNPGSIWDSVTGCITLPQLNRLLTGKIDLYFQYLSRGNSENPVVFQIKEYLHRNYAIPTLSVPDVSEHVHLSSSYVCTLFKSETGMTLNQYLTDYRIKMSKQLLADPRYKITDISSKVGYSDGNYYSKTFRKIVGLSPSEYREKMLS